MFLRLDGYDDLYIKQLIEFFGNEIVNIPCPYRGYCDPSCGLRRFCKLLQFAFNEVCQEKYKRNVTKEQNI